MLWWYQPSEHLTNAFYTWLQQPITRPKNSLSDDHGIMASGEPHLHAIVSDREVAYAGRLGEGCRTLYLAEIAIVEIKEANLTGIHDEKNILGLRNQPKYE